MANLLKSYINHFGLDLKSSDIVREPQYASDMLNAEYQKNGNISKRPGYRGAASSEGGAGLHSYNRIDPTTAKESQILIAVSDTLHELITTTITVSYSGAAASVAFNLCLDKIADVYKVIIVEDTTQVLDFNLGVGIDEVSPVSVTALKTAIEGISADYSVTISGDPLAVAAYLDLVRDNDLVAGDVVMETHSWQEINTPITLLPGNTANQGDDDFYLTTAVQLNNVLYLSNGYDEMIKYDGQNAYRAGLPQPLTSPTAAVGGAGLLNPTDPNGYRYAYLYSQFDAAGNLVEGIESADSVNVNPVNQTVDLTGDNILASSGFNTNCAIVAGAQVGVTTITVDDGAGGSHTMKVGDTAYFFDGVSGGYVEREVTAIAAGTITIAGAAVDVADNAVISNNLRIGIYRNLDGGTQKFLVEEIPNNSFTATWSYNDNIIDSGLTIELTDPIVARGLPPKGRYISSYNNQLFSCGDIDNPLRVSWSDVGEPEYWNPTLYSLQLQSPNGEKLTGLAQSNEVMTVFEKRAMHVLSGDIVNNNIRVDTITKDIGCVSHNTIQEVRGSLYFLSDRGVWKTTSGQIPVEVSDLIEPAFEQDSLVTSANRYVLKRAQAINDRDREQYVLYIPTENTNLVGLVGNDNSIIFTEDYYRGAWLKWNNMNWSGGAAYHKTKIWFTERRNLGSSQIATHLYARSSRGDSWDYEDNVEPINFSYSSAWYSINEPSVFKKFLRMKTYASEATSNNRFMIDVDVEKNFIDGLVANSFMIDFSGNGGGYGISPYGVTGYGDIFFPSRKCKFGPIKARAIRFVLKNNNDCENVDIVGWELEVAMPFRTELKE